MSLIGVSAVRAMSLTMEGKSSKEIRDDAKRHFGLAGDNLFVNAWGLIAEKLNDKKKKKK